MRVSRIGLLDFRSWENLDFAPVPGVNVLVGPNGQGKTNVIEAVGYAAGLGSHRVATDAPLVRQGATQSIIRVEVTRDNQTALIELELNPGRANRARINRAPVPRPREVLGLLRTVLFAPEDLALVRGDPSERRRMMDDLLVARAPRFAGVRADYDRILKQRNALLKSAQAARRGAGLDQRTLDVWDTHLANAGSELLAGRLDLVAALRPLVAEAGAAIGGLGSAQLTIDYKSSVSEELPLTGQDGARELLAAALLAELAHRRTDELDRGVSLVGPHRDDLVLSLGPLTAKGHASHGESWSVALALRLAAYELLRSEGDEPVLILDDVFAEFDPGRRARLAERVAKAEQVLITAAVAEDVPPLLVGARFDVMDGTVTRVL